MAAVHKFLSVSFALIFLLQCRPKHDNSPVFSGQLFPQSPLQGKWKFSHSIYYSSELEFHYDGTFVFHDQGCYGQRFSMGNWTNNNGVVVLTSFDSFNEKLKEPSIQRVEKPQKRGGFVVALQEIPKIKIPGPDDTVRVYLDKVQLELRYDV